MTLEANVALANADRMLAWVTDGLDVDAARAGGDGGRNRTQSTAGKHCGGRDYEPC